MIVITGTTTITSSFGVSSQYYTMCTLSLLYTASYDGVLLLYTSYGGISFEENSLIHW